MISSVVIATNEFSNAVTKLVAWALAPQIVLASEPFLSLPIKSDFALLILVLTLLWVSNVAAILSLTVKVTLPVLSFVPAVTVT